jgi:hypothetical protein
MHPSTRPSQVSSQIFSPPGLSIRSWTSLLSCFAGCFTRPSFAIFWKLIIAWVICPGRHTITRLYLLAEPDGSRAHDAYHRFFRVGAWSLEQLWRRLAIVLVEGLCPDEWLQLAVDDTIFQKWGSKVEGAGRYKDPVRSTGRDVVFVTGLNLVNLGLLVRPSWGGMPLSLPVCVRLYRKAGPNHVELALAMITEVTAWFPGRKFLVVADGAYSALARAKLPRTVIVSRTRKNAELYDPQPIPRPPGTRGRPRLRGDRLASPCQMAQNPGLPWRVCQVEVRGRQIERLIYTRVVLWWFTCREAPVLLVIVRDPSGRNQDEYLFTTDSHATPVAVVSAYADRWAIEETHRNCKQFLGAEDPQCWRSNGPARAGAMSLFSYSLVWYWYVIVHGDCPAWQQQAWYGSKATPSFVDALATARRELWRDRVFGESDRAPLSTKFQTALIETLAYAA